MARVVIKTALAPVLTVQGFRRVGSLGSTNRCYGLTSPEVSPPEFAETNVGADNDTDVNTADLAVWLTQFGQHAAIAQMQAAKFTGINARLWKRKLGALPSGVINPGWY